MSKNHNRETKHNSAPRTLRSDIETLNNKYPRLKKVLAGTAIASVATFGGIKLVEHLSGPKFSDATIDVSVYPGDGLQVVVSNIDGIENIDWRDAAHHVRNMPENADVFENNQLDPGEVVIVPESVKR